VVGAVVVIGAVVEGAAVVWGAEVEGVDDEQPARMSVTIRHASITRQINLVSLIPVFIFPLLTTNPVYFMMLRYLQIHVFTNLGWQQRSVSLSLTRILYGLIVFAAFPD